MPNLHLVPVSLTGFLSVIWVSCHPWEKLALNSSNIMYCLHLNYDLVPTLGSHQVGLDPQLHHWALLYLLYIYIYMWNFIWKILTNCSLEQTSFRFSGRTMHKSIRAYIMENRRSRSWIWNCFTECRYSLISNKAVMAPWTINCKEIWIK